jgi:hypothetical protein
MTFVLTYLAAVFAWFQPQHEQVLFVVFSLSVEDAS